MRSRAALLTDADFVSIQEVGRDRRGGRSTTWNRELRSWLNTRLLQHCNLNRNRASRHPAKVDQRQRKNIQKAFSILDEHRKSLTECAQNVLVNYRWKEFYDAFDRVRSLKNYRRRAGRPRDEWLDEFIAIVAEAYHRAGGKVSAAPQPNGKRETPFLRVLRAIYQKLPEERQTAKSLSALDVRARRAIPRWDSMRKIGWSF